MVNMPQQLQLAKKASLSYKELASHDDFITDMMIDHVWFWTTIRKNHSYYKAERLIKEEHITKRILQPKITHMMNPRLEEAMSLLEELPAVQKYMSKLTSDAAKDHFRKHLQRYVEIYMPDCSFEITTTNRYLINEEEASVTARKSIKRGETIKYLCGLMVNLTPEDEAELDKKRRAFSIVLSSRKKTMSLFLGPARLANHDCEPNAKLNATNSNRMEIVARRDINFNEEITVSYGDDYFGEDNCECLCSTCERLTRNGWAHNAADRATARSISSSIEYDYPAHSTRLQKRVFPSDSSSSSRISTPDILSGRSRKKAKPSNPPENARQESTTDLTNASMDLHNSCAEGKKNDNNETEATPTVGVEICSQSCDISRTAQPSNRSTLVSRLLASMEVPSDESDSQSAVASSALRSPHSPKSAKSTPATSVSGEEPNQSLKVQNAMNSSAGSVTPDPLILPSTEILQEGPANDSAVGAQENTQPVNINSDAVNVRTVETHCQPDAPTTSRLKRKKSRRSSPPLEPPRRRRYPGDYKDEKLVLLAGSKRLQCGNINCQGYFVQANAYEPHANCPRCERHSKLYGFEWPKSEREGEHDMEIRVTDHRVINRVLGVSSKRNQEDTEEEDEGAESSNPKKSKKGAKDVATKPVRKYGGIWKDWKPLEEEWAEKWEEAKKANRYKRTKKVKASTKVTVTNAKKPNGVRKLTVTKTVKVNRR